MLEALAGVLLFFSGYFFCAYQRDTFRKDTATTAKETLTEEERLELRQQTEQIKAFQTMMNYDENTAYSGGMSDAE